MTALRRKRWLAHTLDLGDESCTLRLLCTSVKVSEFDALQAIYEDAETDEDGRVDVETIVAMEMATAELLGAHVLVVEVDGERIPEYAEDPEEWWLENLDTSDVLELGRVVATGGAVTEGKSER